MSRGIADLEWATVAVALAGVGLVSGAISGCFLLPIQCDEEGAAMAANGGEQTVLPAVDAERAIVEADIVQIVGDRLYALSTTAGLNIIDVSVRDELTLLGRATPSAGEPFEMYVRDGVVIVMTDLGEEAHQSEVRAYDVSDPTAIAPMGSFRIPGHVSDSRIVGEALYVVTFEDHWCSGCPAEATTTVSSYSIGGHLDVVDMLSYEQRDVDGRGWKRSVTVTTERMYVAGVEWDGTSNDGHSTIQVVDISDPTGQLVEGDRVDVAGQILNRWQMDERDGVLRVLSQPGAWSDSDPPRVETFTVLSSQELVPLGSLPLVLPVPESLRSVRFDGDRAYAITAQAPEPYDPGSGAETDPTPPPVDRCGPNCDPLFVVDLSDPAQPVQLGELEMPGWVFHMEPRGDRLLALGFESTYPLGPLNVSLFDVADGAHPRLLERTTFGGDWAGLSEDQNRIHKAFTIVDELGLILVPYGWWAWQEHQVCEEFTTCGGDEREWCYDDGNWARRGAVQLLDFTADTLVARGSADLQTWTLRALIHDTRLLAVSDEQVGSFDIDDRDAPSPAAMLTY